MGQYSPHKSRALQHRKSKSDYRADVSREISDLANQLNRANKQIAEMEESLDDALCQVEQAQRLVTQANLKLRRYRSQLLSLEMLSMFLIILLIVWAVFS